jgi:glycerophosphoryl diester phosphodiesterase
MSPAPRRVEVIAHRGFSGAAPENTLAAFREAIRAGADRVELDVLLTLDGVPVVIHDPDLDRTTDGRGPVRQRTLAELRALDAGRWFDPRFAGERIPTLEEALELCRGKVAVNVEIKGEAVAPGAPEEEEGVEARVVESLRRLGPGADAVVSSFEPLALRRVRRMAPELARESLFDPERQGGMGPVQVCAEVAARAFNCSREEVSPRWIDEAHRAGLKLNVYTVDDPREMEALIALGVDGIFTNQPRLLREALARGPASGGRAGAR